MRPHFLDDSDNVVEQPSVVALPLLFSGDRIRLARVARSDDIHNATPRSAVERGKVIPDRSVIQGLVRHPRHESGRTEGFPLNVTHTAGSGFCRFESELKPADAGAEGKHVDGR